MGRTVVIGTLLCATACGSTVGLNGASPSRSTPGQLDGLGAPLAPTYSVDVPALSSDGAVGPTASPTRTASDGAHSPGNLTTTEPNDSLASQHYGIAGETQGLTATTIKIGALALRGGGGLANGMGLPISFGDAKAEFTSLINDLNARGGINGRKVVLDLAVYDLSGSAIDPEGQQASLCTHFTQDAKDFAVLTPYNPLPSFLDCMAKHKTLLINESANTIEPSIANHWLDWVYSPSLIGYPKYLDDLARAYAAHGGLKPGTKVAIITIDNPIMNDPADHVLKPAIEASGAKVVQISRVSGDSTANADIASAVLTAKTNLVTAVFFVQAAGGVPLYFMQDAQQQGYHPRYAIATPEVAGSFLEGSAPAAQLAKASGIGWEPTLDLSANQLPSTVEERRCFAVEEKGGEHNSDRSSNLTATAACDLVWSFEAAARAAGRTLTTQGWRTGLRSLGTSWRSVLTFATNFGDGRPNGAAAWRWISWIDSCSCFRYSGANNAFK